MHEERIIRTARETFERHYWTGAWHILAGAVLVGVIFESWKSGLSALAMLIGVAYVGRTNATILAAALVEAMQDKQAG